LDFTPTSLAITLLLNPSYAIDDGTLSYHC
jgi:hypothetical protein